MPANRSPNAAASARSRMEIELTRRMLQMANCMADAIVVLDSRGKFRFWNRKAERMFGYKNNEIIGEEMHSTFGIPRRDLKKILASRANSFRGRTVETESRRRSGAVFPVEITLSGTKIEGQWFLVSIVKDITQRKLAEKVLSESEEKFRNLAEKSPNMIFINQHGRLVYVNSRCIEVMGYSRREFYSPSFDFRRLIAPDCRAAIARNYRRHGQGREMKPYEYAILTRNGRRIDCINSTRLINYGGKKAILGIVTDITERKQSEAEIQRAKIHLERIIASLHEALLIVDRRTGRITMCNPAVERTFGYKPRELIGQQAELLHAGRDRYRKFQRLLNAALKKNCHYKTEYEMKRRDGTLFPTAYSATLITDENSRWIGTVNAVSDISLQKRTQEWIAQYQKRLRILASELSNTEERERRRLAVKLHDYVGQNLALAKIRLGFLKQNLHAESRPIVKEIREMIEKSIRDIRTFTFELSPPILYDVGLEAAIEWLSDETRKQSGLKIRLVSERSPKPIPVEIRTFLFNAVRELLVNIMKHAQANRVVITIRRQAPDVLVEVRDDGRGIPAIQAKSVKADGYGIFSLRERLKLYGGELKIRSMPGQGTKIAIRCPMNPDRHA